MLYGVVSIYFFVMAMAVVYCTAYIRSLNGSGYARIAVLLCLATCIYILGYSMELNSESEAQIVFWNKVEYLGIPFISALWLTIGLMYTGHCFHHRKLLFAAVYGVPFISLLLRFTNDFHHLYIASERFINQYGKLLLLNQPGPWRYVQMVHSMIMIFITFGLFILDSVRSGEKETGKICLIMASSFFAAAGLLDSVFRPFGLYIDYMAFCLPAAGFMVILAVLRYDFLETKSMARSKVFDASRDAILLINRQNKVIDYNRSARALLEKIKVSISGGSVAALFERVPVLRESLGRTKTSVVKLNIGAEDRYYEISTKGIDETGASRGWIKTIRDVTEIYKLNENLKKQAMMDELSGLCNRRAFITAGKDLMEKSELDGGRIHLLMMDLDYFKKVNDQYGHQSGDQVIRSFGGVLREIFHAESLIARLGGEEFAVLLPGFSDSEILRKAETVLRDTELQEHNNRGRKFHVTVSIGVAKKTRPSQTLESLMHLADQALYQSKDSGRNCVTVS